LLRLGENQTWRQQPGLGSRFLVAWLYFRTRFG
jgi:hypothetical protein